MNFKDMAENLGLQQDVFTEMLTLFLDTTISDLDRLGIAMEEGELQSVLESAHSIKGAALSFGFEEVADLAGQIEVNARGGTLEGGRQTVEALRDRVGSIAARMVTKPPAR